jgi:uncharacterized membrane protein
MTGRFTWSALIGVAGLAVSFYLTATHYLSGQVPLACATGGLVNCEQVTSSPQSMVGPVPVAVLGLIWFGVWLAMLRLDASRTLLWLRLAWSVLGLLSVFYLVYAELFLIGAICVWCSVVHVAVIALFLLAVAEASNPTPVAELSADGVR